jgi:hypothetical protein
MLKIMLNVRNRLSITKKCIESIEKNAVEPYKIYVYDNLTNYRVADHFEYWRKLYEEGRITQITINTKDSTFNAFSKASSSNMFGAIHEQDPEKDSYAGLLFLDNDIIIVRKKFDKLFRKAWVDIKKNKMNDVKIVGQWPGGIKHKVMVEHKLAGVPAVIGKLGGSGMWYVKPNFFRDVGFLPLKRLVGQHKQHDQIYWSLCEHATKGAPYIVGLKQKIGIHCGHIAGSLCNNLQKGRNDPKILDKIKFEKSDKMIEDMTYDEFHASIVDDKFCINDW